MLPGDGCGLEMKGIPSPLLENLRGDRRNFGPPVLVPGVLLQSLARVDAQADIQQIPRGVEQSVELLHPVPTPPLAVTIGFALYAVAVTAQLSEAVRLLIVQLMEARKMKGTHLAAAAGLPQTSVSRKLRKVGTFDLDDIAAIGPVFGLKGSDLITWAERSLHSEG
jgi:hypothetical protein